MGKFQLKINVAPEDIPGLDDVHKRDCADVLRGIINSVFKYTLIFSLGVMAFFGVYSLFSLTYLMRMNDILPQMPMFMPILGVVIFFFEFISGTMRKWALIVQILLNIALTVTVAATLQTVWIVPFALYSVGAHFKLLTLLPIHKVLSQQHGYPEFTPLPAKDEIAAGNKSDIG